MSKTAAVISADLSALNAHVASLKERADALSLPAVSGDEEARRSLAGLLREIDRVTAERSIFEAGLTQARQREAEASRAVDAAERKRHMTDAREIAGRIIDTGKRADEIINSYLGVIQALDADERALHRALRSADMPMSPGIHGAYNIAALANERMRATTEGRLNRLSDQRSMSAILSAAMADITENENV